MSDRRMRQLEERRQRILSSAQRLFVEVGFDNITMQDIADAAEVSKGSLYLQFRNKDDLIMALVHASFDRLEELVTTEAGGPGTACERLGRIARAYIQYALEDPGNRDHLWLIARLTPNPNSEHQAQIQERVTKLGGVIARIFDEGAADKSVRPGLDAKTLIFLFTLVMTSLIERISKLRSSINPIVPATEESLLTQFMDLFIYYVQP